jgi:hypothetical protein
MVIHKDEKQLLYEFVAAFEKLNDLSASLELDPVASELSFGEFDDYGFKQWRPIGLTTDRSHLDELYIELPERFPPLPIKTRFDRSRGRRDSYGP